MGSLIAILVTIVVLGLVFYLLHWLVGQMPLPEPFQVVARVLLALAAVVVLLSLLFGYMPLPVLRVRGI